MKNVDAPAERDLHSSTILSQKKGIRDCSESSISHFSPIIARSRSRLSGVTPALRDLSPNTDISSQQRQHSPSIYRTRAKRKMQPPSRAERRDKENDHLLSEIREKSDELLKFVERNRDECYGRPEARESRLVRKLRAWILL